MFYPQGMSLKGISAGEIDATGKALKEVGAVNILIDDTAITASYGSISYIGYGIFPDASTAKSASELIGTHFGNGEVLIDFPYPAKIYSTANIYGIATTAIVVSVENVTLVTSLTGIVDSYLAQSRSILLAQAAIKHLEKVGK